MVTEVDKPNMLGNDLLLMFSFDNDFFKCWFSLTV